ncbi:MAG: ATP-binding protein [Oscillospiraceae bacterium]
MADNITENSLLVSEEKYHRAYNDAITHFNSVQYKIDPYGLNNESVYYIRILSVEKAAEINPAMVIREQMQKALMALWTVGMRFNMIINHCGSTVEIYVGTVCPKGNYAALFGLKDIFSGTVPGIEFETDNANKIKAYELNHFLGSYRDKSIGFFVGHPVVCDLPESSKGVSAIDEIISGSEGRDWILCICAVPVSKADTVNRRTDWYAKLAESSRFTNVSFEYNVVGNNRSMNVQEQYPGTGLYNEFAKKNCSEYDEAVQCGEWSVGAFCAAKDDASRNVFGGMFSAHMKSGTEKIERPFPFEYRTNTVMQFKASLQVPSDDSTTKLSTRELAAICALPVRDTFGFSVAEHVDFDIHRGSNGNLSIGKIVNGRNITNAEYRIELDSLNRHGLIIGLTGGGKTNTVKSLLHSFHSLNCPFMIIEPAKKEYYEIYNMGIKDLRIYSVGSSEGIPLYINPFEVVRANGRSVSLQSHIDAVFAAFKASFIMYPPMPYVLENAIYAIYNDYGWDPANNVNRFGRTDYPTLEDLYYKIEPIVREMGYDQKMQNDLIGSLTARINSLRVGSKGGVLNVASSVNMEELLDGNTVIELDDLNDEDAKAFIISLLLLQIQECRKVQPTTQLKVRHILLIEEAHRLLKNVSSGTGENADPRGNAVEFFCNMLAEMRSKGQGFLVIDQSPTKLAPDLIKNTNLKLIHRTVAGDDRHLVGSAMNMTEAQESYLSCLKQGYAAVYSEGDNRPKVVKLPYAGDYTARDIILDRSSILAATSTLYKSGGTASPLCYVNQNSINPICRHCRMCSEWMNPESRCSADRKTLDTLKKSYSLQAHEALKLINSSFGKSDIMRKCAIAAWFKANEAGTSDYKNYSRILDFVIRKLFN